MNRWSVVIPFKGAPDGKSRLAHEFGVAERAALALAFLEDTVRAVRGVQAVARILVVSNEPDLDRALAGDLGSDAEVMIVADPGGGLNTAVSRGVDRARAIDDEDFVAALTGDLAALQSRDLAHALDVAVAEAGEGRPLALVADRDGSGTTMITAAPRASIVPHFGIESCALHVAAGHFLIPLAPDSSLRLDLDSESDLHLAVALTPGLGPATRSVLAGRLSG